MVADKVLLDLFLKEREIEHIRGFCDITSGAIIVKNLDMIVANDVTAPGAGFDVNTNIVTLITREEVKSLPRPRLEIRDA